MLKPVIIPHLIHPDLVYYDGLLLLPLPVIVPVVSISSPLRVTILNLSWTKATPCWVLLAPTVSQ